jgi:uncharacterized protein (DUF362 family)
MTIPLSRRQFLLRAARAGSVAVGTPLLLSGCVGAPFDTLIPSNTAPKATARAKVGTASGTDLAELAHAALERIGGIARVVRPGETVFIKPNLLTAGLPRSNHTQTGEITKPELIVAVAEECLRAGASRVTIGDGAQVADFDWEELRTLDESAHLQELVAGLIAAYDDRVRLASLNADSPDWTAYPTKRCALGQIYVSSLVAEADRVISIPVLKTHRHSVLSLSMKNFMGVTPIAHYGGGSEDIGRFILHLNGAENCFLDVVDGLRPDLTVIDGSIGVEDYGPWVRPDAGRSVDLRDRRGEWLVIASTDLVAADATAARVLGHDPAQVPHVARASREGLGQIDTDLIDVAGPDVATLRMDWEPAPRASGGDYT